MEKYNPTKFCRACGEKGIDFRVFSALKNERDQIKMKKRGNENRDESKSTLDAIEEFRKKADEYARNKNQQN